MREEEEMKITIDGTANEIADLVLAVQGQLGGNIKTVETYSYSDSPIELLGESINSVLRGNSRDTNEEKSS